MNITTTSSFSLASINSKHRTSDNPSTNTLVVYLTEAQPPQNVVITGNDYVNLGQWTDGSLTNYLCERYNVTGSY